MKAATIQKKPKPAKLVYKEVAIPDPKAREFLIRVAACSINAADYRTFKMGMISDNKILGSAVSGVVEAIGDQVKTLNAGDKVIADLTACGFGGLAEYACASESAITLKPENITHEEAATLPVAATTALNAVRDKAQVKEGQQVLIVGSGGGVGGFAIQLCKYYSAMVTAVCSEKNAEISLNLGADEVIDYTKTDFTKSNNTYDVILAINGNYALQSYKAALRPGGTCVVVGGSLNQIFKTMFFGKLHSLSNKKFKLLASKTNTEDLQFVSTLMSNAHLQSNIHNTYKLSQSNEAFHHIKEGHIKGKLVIKMKE